MLQKGGARLAGTLMAALAFLSHSTPIEADCLTAEDPISTDRPTAANSSPVIPMGSLQLENGASVSQGQGGATYDAPETRARLGLGSCTEFLVDLPDYTRADIRNGVNGASNIGPAVKHQFQALIDGLTLFGTVGVFLNTGDKDIAGRGPAPYAQIPWSYDLGENWSINGMFSATVRPREANDNPALQTSLYLDRTIATKFDVFVEYINDYQRREATLNRAGIGGSYRVTPNQQLDVKIGAGLNSSSPDWSVSVGYSFRFDKLF